MAGFSLGLGFDKAFSQGNGRAPALGDEPPLSPGNDWTGIAGSGFASPPADPERLNAKPIIRMLDAPRQTVTDSLTIGVGAAANFDGFLLPTMGIARVDFHFEGSTVTVDAPTWRTFSRHDGSTYNALGWWASLKRPSGSQGIANLYVEAVPLDPTMQNRVIGPFAFLLYAQRYDFDLVVRADGAGDFTQIGDALALLATLNAQRPRIRITQSGVYDLGGAGSTYDQGAGWCTIEASQPVTIAQPPPASQATFTRFRPFYERLRFKGSNLTLDFVETLQFYNERAGGEPWFDGISIIQSRGRNDLWRRIPRNIIPSLTRLGGYFVDCLIKDVSDVGDKAILARGNITDATWGDLFQGAECVAHNLTTDHSSAFYYTNIDAMSVQYTGDAASATVARQSGAFLLFEDGIEIGRFTLDKSSAGFTADTNYRVASLVAWINGKTGWSATLIDDSRAAAFISRPGTTNGSDFSGLHVKSSPQILPTHFDIHSDYFQVPNSALMENVYIAFNESYRIDAQNFLIATDVENNVRDFAIIGNAFYNNLGTADEGLQTGLGIHGKHLVFAHNTFATQRISVPPATGTADAYTLIANNVVLRIAVTNGEPLNPAITVRNNHVQENIGLPPGAIGTGVGGDELSLFGDAINGDFSPAGILLAAPAQVAMGYSFERSFFGSIEPVGAVSLGTAEEPAARPAAPRAEPVMASPTTVGATSSGTNSVSITDHTPAAGDNRRILVFANVRGQGCSNISATITGSAGTATLNQIAFQGSRFDNAHANAFETLATFDIAEAEWPGEGPYLVTATAAHAATAGGMAIQVATIANAPNSVSAVTANGSVSGGITPLTGTIELTEAGSLVIAAIATSAYSGAANWAQGLTTFGDRLDYGDLQMIGVASGQPSGSFTATVDRSLGRESMILFVYARGAG